MLFGLWSHGSLGETWTDYVYNDGRGHGRSLDVWFTPYPERAPIKAESRDAGIGELVHIKNCEEGRIPIGAQTMSSELAYRILTDLDLSKIDPEARYKLTLLAAEHSLTTA